MQMANCAPTTAWSGSNTTAGGGLAAAAMSCGQCGLPPDRPARRSRSPNDARDRRAFSADRPVTVTGVVKSNAATMPSGSAAIGAASRAKTRSVGPTKVERLRQLTQRLRPSSSPSCSRDGLPPSGLPPLATLSLAINCAQLPPIPVAPPRHADRKGRNERNKTARDKRDSATSTSDLVDANPAVCVQPSATCSVSVAVSATSASEPVRRSSASASDAGGALPISWPESDAKNSDDIVRKKTAAGSSAEVTRPSLFWSPAVGSATATKTPPPLPPTNDDGQWTGQPHGKTQGASLFASHRQRLDSGSDVPSSEDLFDDAQHLTLSKLNPRILVGTYTQRTIPFRSASFSQIDVGADGTYNRRPRTSITLKPVTYSIGRNAAAESPAPGGPLQSASSTCLPRSLPSSGTSSVPLFQLAEEPNCPAVATAKCEAPKLWKDRSSSSEDYDPADALAAEIAQQPLNDPSMEQVCEKAGAPSSDGAIAMDAPVAKDSNPEEEKAPADYETTEVSVSAEIRFSPVPGVASAEPADEPESSSSLKALPVLDLLELNNHLLRLKAATRESGGSALADHLADLEVAAQFEAAAAAGSDEPSSRAQLPDSDSGLVKQDSAESAAERPCWLNELLRLTNGESTSSLSDEGCVADSNEFSTPCQTELSCMPALSSSAASVVGEEASVYGTPPEQPSQLSLCSSTSSTPIPHPRPQMARTNSGKRRRRSSSLAVSSLTVSVVDSGMCTKSNSARSLTFLPTKSEAAAAAAESTTTSDSMDNNNQRVIVSNDLAGGHMATDDSVSSDTFVDVFQPAVDGRDEEDPQIPSAVRLDLRPPDESPPPNSADQTATASTKDSAASQRTSAASEDQDDDDQNRSAGNVKVTEESQATAKPTSHRLTVSVNLTLAPDPGPNASSRNTSPSPFSPDLLLDGSSSSGCFSPTTDKAQNKSPLTPRRYGLKRRPLRGPYGEMLEAEMNKSEFGKMYSKRTAEDLSFLREPTCPRNREAKSSSPRPVSPPQTSPGASESSTAACVVGSAVGYNVRQNSLPLPTFHSLDDSQLKVGYNSISGSSSTLPPHLPSSASASPARLVLPPKRKISANIPYVFSDGDLESSGSSTATTAAASNRSNNKSPLPVASQPDRRSDGLHMRQLSVVSGAGSNHQRTSSSPCQLMQFTTEAGFTSEDEPELLELTSLSALSRSTARLLESASQQDPTAVGTGAERHTLPLTRAGSAKRQRVRFLSSKFRTMVGRMETVLLL